MTFLIVDPWQSCVCFIRSCLTRCTLLMVLYLDHICQCSGRICGATRACVTVRPHAVFWSHIGTLMHCLAAEPCSTAGLLFPSLCPSLTVLLTSYCGTVGFQEQGQCFFIGLRCSIYSLLLFFPFSCFCLYVGIVGLGSLD